MLSVCAYADNDHDDSQVACIDMGDHETSPDSELRTTSTGVADMHDVHRDEIDPAAAIGFDRQAGSYSKVRPTYPQGVGDVLLSQAGLVPGSNVCDLGAGTGIFTRFLVALGMNVTAVEPVGGMRDQFVADTAGIDPIDATAEHLPFADETFDAVTAAQCFHWFDPQPALREIARVLKPGGVLVMLWNARDESVDWMNQWGDLVAELGGGRPYQDHREMLWEDVVAEAGLFSPLESTRMANSQVGSPEMVIDRTRSTSFIAALPEDRHNAALAAVAELIASHPDTAGRTEIVIPYETVVYWCRRN